MKMKFDWNEKKEKANLQKHNVSFLEACFVFSDLYALNLFDAAHSTDEERWITIGQTLEGKTLIVAHTFRCAGGKELIRIISERKATKNEMKQYFDRRP